MVSFQPQEPGADENPRELASPGSEKAAETPAMANDAMGREEAAELRGRAEEVWWERASGSASGIPDKALSLLHELEVHQIELETQNRELLRAQEELAALHARYFDLFDLAPVGYLVLDAHGLIQEANVTPPGCWAWDAARR